MNRLRAAFWLMIMVATSTTLRGADLIPVPEFANHAIPQTQTPIFRTPWSDALDLAFLAVALAASSYCALKSRSRRGLFLIAVVSVAWLGFWRKGCVCPIGAIQNVTQGLFDPSYVVSWSVVAVFALPLVFTLFFGRTFCASVCPLGAVQELVAIRPIQVPRAIDQALGLLAYVYLGGAVLFAATGTAWIICRYDPFVGLFRLSSSSTMLAVSAGFLIVGMFIGRPYCRWLCPYGAILAMLARVARRRLTIPPKNCVQCRLCEGACPYGAIVRPTIPLTADEIRKARRRLLLAFAVLPLFIASGVMLGRFLEGALARVHPTVRLAQRIRQEDEHLVDGTTDASEAFRAAGKSPAELDSQAGRLRQTLGQAGMLFGAWVGLVFGVKLIQLCVRRRRSDFEPDRSSCVSCGRCFWYCPQEPKRQGWMPT